MGKKKILQTPWQKFSTDSRPLEYPWAEDALQVAFRVPERRTVSKDHVISLNGGDYEVPRAFTPGERIIVYRGVLDGRVTILHEGRSVTLHLVDLVANAYDRRVRPNRKEKPPESPPPKSAADLAFERDLGSVTDADGGFTDPDGEPEEESWI